MRNSIFLVGRHLAVITTLLALIGMATSAQAASFRRGWDPLFNAAFPFADLGWRGEAVIFVSDLCVSASSTASFLETGVPVTCGEAYIESYTLEFYDIGTPLVTLDSASDSAPGSPLFPTVKDVRFDGGSIADGVTLWGDIEVTGTFSFSGIDYTAFMSLGLDLVGLDSTSLRLEEICDYDDVCPTWTSEVEPTVEWSQVPTPAPLALLGIGLLALTMTRRRKA